MRDEILRDDDRVLAAVRVPYGRRILELEVDPSPGSHLEVLVAGQVVLHVGQTHRDDVPGKRRARVLECLVAQRRARDDMKPLDVQGDVHVMRDDLLRVQYRQPAQNLQFMLKLLAHVAQVDRLREYFVCFSHTFCVVESLFHGDGAVAD